MSSRSRTPSSRMRSPSTPLGNLFREDGAPNTALVGTKKLTPRSAGRSPSRGRSPSGGRSPSHRETSPHNPSRMMTPREQVVHARESVLSFDVASLFSDRTLWLYAFLTVIVLIVVFVIVRDNNVNLHSWSRAGILFQNQYLLAVVFTLVLILAAHSTYLGHTASGRLWQNTLVSTFLVVGVASAILAYLVYRAHAFSGAFWLSLVLLVGTLIHAYLVWRVHALAGYECLPLVLFFLLTTYHLYFMSEEAAEPSTCLPVYEVV